MGVISQSQRSKSLGQSGTLGLSQRPRSPTPWGLFLNLRDPKAWDSLRHWDCPKDPESQHHGGYFSISETQKPGTVWDCPKDPESQKPGSVPGLWDCPRSNGQSREIETQHHGGYFSISETQNPGTVSSLWDMSQKPWTVPGRWDCPTDPEFQHH